MDYTDIDLAFQPTVKNDISILDGLVSCVKNNLYNNLMVPAAEVPFDNSLRPNIYDVIHNDTALTRNIQIQDAIEYACKRDDRIKKINSINLLEETDYLLTVELKLTLSSRIAEILTFNLKLSKL